MFLKLAAYALLAYVIYMVVKFFSALNRGNRPQAPKQKAGGIMVKDEVCNTYLPKEEAVRELYQGQEYFFCSEECRRKFLETKKPH